MGQDDRIDSRHDELTSRAAALAPGRNAPRLSPEELRSLATHAMRKPQVRDAKSSSPRAWSRRRVGYASLGAVIGSGALLVAVILGIGAAAPSLPALGSPATTTSLPVRSLPVLKVRSGPVSGGYGMGGLATNSVVIYKFVADPDLSTATGSSTAYVLSSPADMATATGTIATALGLPDTVTYLGPENYNGGSADGPNVTVDSVAGILNWLYPTWSGNVNTDPALANPQSIAVNPNAPLPSDGQATTDAEQLLQAAGVSVNELGVPTVSRYEAGVNVAFQVAAGGLQTDQEMQVEYGPGATVLTASGIIATTTPSTTYPTISPTDAVGLLTSTSDSSSGPTSSSIVTVDISQATMTLATYTLEDGRNCLLPTWNLSGSESGSTGPADSTYSGSVLAVPAKYVQFEPVR
jgi:hypothetical protein